jgi:hypothetical protein
VQSRCIGKFLRIIASGKWLWHGVVVKKTPIKPVNGSTNVEAEVRQLHATGKRIASNRKSILRFLAATGMYTADGKLKPQFR